jgi:hypothetical protein
MITFQNIDLDSLETVTGGTAQRIPDIRDSFSQGGTIFNPQPPVDLPQPKPSQLGFPQV